jgi:hypothetical protein
MQKSPIAIVKERFNDKEGLISAVKALATDDLWLERLNDDKGLPHVSNKKLLHLHDVLSTVQKEHGSRAKLIEAILATEKRAKDAGYRAGLEKKATPQLLEIFRATKKRNKTAAS